MSTRRVVQTLRGPAWYEATGYTKASWALVQDAMRRCYSPGLHLVGEQRPKTQPTPKAPRPRHGRHTPDISPISKQLRELADELDRKLGDPMA